MFLNNHLTIVENQSSGFILFSISHQSPLKAQLILESFLNDLDNHFRILKRQRAEEAIDFYDQETRNTPNKNLQLSLSKLIEDNYQSLSFSYMTSRFVLNEIDPPHLPEFKVYPNRTSLALIYGFIGFMVSIILSLLWIILKRNKK